MRALCALLVLHSTAWPPTDTAEKPAAQHEFQGPEYCATCHPRHYQEWRGSSHAYAAINPLVQACNRKALRDTDGKIGGLCVNCHAPVAARAGEFTNDFNMDALSPLGRKGVSCEICHRMEHPKADKPIANASFELAEGNVFYGRLRHPTATPAHESMHGEFLGKSVFCGTCHDVLHNGALLEKSYAQWQGSIHDERGDQCQSCHMLRYSGQAAVGGPFRETLHRHNFPAVTVALVPFPNQGYQREQIQEFLRTAARMEVRAPQAVAAGQELAFTVSVKNSGTGHNLPSGLSNERQMWIEATVTNGDRRVLYQSGGLDSNGDLMDHHSELRPGADPALALFNDRFLNSSGEEVPFIWLASSVEERSLKPLEERGSTYRAPMAADLVGDRARIRVRLLFRPFPPYAMRDLGLGELVKNLPTWVMDDWTSDWIPIRGEVERQSVWRVPEDFPTLDAAMKALRDGDRLVVAPGEHVIERPLDFGGRKVVVQSVDGPTRTLIRLAGEAAARAASVVVFQSGEGPETRMEGFRLTGGRGSLIDGLRRGGGVYINRSHPSLVDIQVTNCEASDGLGGGIYCEQSSPVVSRVEIRNGKARQGGGLYIAGANSRVVTERLRIHGSTAEIGAGVFVGVGADLRLEFAEIAGNQALQEGGGLFAEEGSTWTVTRSTLVFNHAAGTGPAALRARGGTQGSVSNSILVSNEPPGADAELSYSLIDFATPSTTCLKGFPLFMDPSGRWNLSTNVWEPGDYRLLLGSIAIDAGAPGTPPDPDDSIADLGAHFFEQRPKPFVRGDVNRDGLIDTQDLLALFASLVGTVELSCLDAGDVNDDGHIRSTDLAWLVSHVLGAGVPPEYPWPKCGLDPTLGEGLSCVQRGMDCREE